MDVLKKEITKRIRKDARLRTRLAYELGKVTYSITNYCDYNDNGEATLLVTPMAVRAIAEETGLKEAEILTQF